MVVLYKLQYNNTHKSKLKDETKYDLCNIVPKKLKTLKTLDFEFFYRAMLAQSAVMRQ